MAIRSIPAGFIRLFVSPRFALARGILMRAFLLVALIYAGTRIVAPIPISLSSGVLEVRVVPRLPGGRVIAPLGPLGQVSWNALKAPVDIEANLRLPADATTLPTAEDIDLGKFRGEYLRRSVPWMIVFGIAAGLLAVQGTNVRRSRAAIGGVGATLGLATLVAAVGVLTFDEDALGDPRYRGPIGDVPRIVSLVKEIQRDFPGTKRNIARAVEGLARIRRDLLANPRPADEQTTKLLLMSDLQSNPLGVLLAERLVREFDIDGIVDAGDFSERGTAIEAEIYAPLGRLGVPIVMAPGNHEDRPALERLRRVEQITIIDGIATAEIGGVTILGAADPNSQSIEADPRNDIADEEVPIICANLLTKLAETNAQLLLVHDPRLGECAAEDAKLREHPMIFAWGHTQKVAFKVDGSVVRVSAGTSGSNGPKSPTRGKYGFAMLEFDSASNTPVSVCLFAFTAPESLADASCHVLPRAAP